MSGAGTAGSSDQLLPGRARAARATRARAAPARRSVRRLLRRARAAAPPGSQRAAASRSTRTRSRSPPAASCRERAIRARCPTAKRGRRDYRLAIPAIEDSERLRHDRRGRRGGDRGALRRARCEAIPFAARGRADARRAVRAAGRLEHPATLIANLATHHLWGSRASVAAAARLPARRRAATGPAPDWDVGPLRVRRRPRRGPRGQPVRVADTYPSLGDRGVHLQPRERLAAAIAA